jgi:hypothetical protein
MEEKILDFKPEDDAKPETSIIMRVAKLVTLLVVLYVIIFY